MANRSDIESYADEIKLDEILGWGLRAFDAQGNPTIADGGRFWAKRESSRSIVTVDQISDLVRVTGTEEERQYLARRVAATLSDGVRELRAEDRLRDGFGAELTVTEVVRLTRRGWILITARVVTANA